MIEYRSVLLLKLPFCTHPDASGADNDFRTKAPFRPIPSLALAVLAAFFEKYKSADYRLQVVDSNIEAYTGPGVPIDTSVYMELLRHIITDNDYDVLALSSLFVFNVRWVETAVRLSRQLRPGAKIILGGGYPTLFPEHALERHEIDSVVVGEGEATFLHILNKYNHIKDAELEKKFPFGGYAERNENGEFVNVPIAKFIDMADLPTPAWDKLDVGKYFKNSGDRLLPIEGSRGCPYRCTYCCTNLSWGNKVRYKPVEHLLNEMTETGEKYDVETLHFNDDNLAFRKDWLVAFLNRAKDKRFPFKFSASNYSVLHLDEEIIDLLVKVYGPGQFVGIAVETGSRAMQKQIRKNLDFDKIRDVVRMMKEKKLHVHIHWMVGFPGETIGQILKTFAFARELRGHSNQFLTVTPYPGTQLFREAEKAGLLTIPKYDFDKYDNRRSEYIKSDEWDYALLQEMIYDANIEINFLNHPQLDIPEEIDAFQTYLVELLKRLPDHIISRILAGFIHKKKGNLQEREEYYRSAFQRFSDEGLCDTFSKYLDWDYESIVDFKDYLQEKGLTLPVCE